jgi:hypothetical protein
LQTYPQRIVCPGRPLHLADLNVEGEVLDADVARRLEDPVRQPLHLAARVHHHVRVDHGRVVTRVGTEMDTKIIFRR